MRLGRLLKPLRLNKWSLMAGVLIVLLLVVLSVQLTIRFLLKPPSSATLFVSDDFSQMTTFPVGIDRDRRLIVEHPGVDSFVTRYLSSYTVRNQRYLDKLAATIASRAWLQQLASANSRTLVIYSGERREEVAKNFGDILGWTKSERDRFVSLVTEAAPALVEGKFYPGRYVVARRAKPDVVAALVIERFQENIANRYDTQVSEVVSLEEALTIASLLEREAYDFTDMRIISGIIWNRLFIDMPLQLDASLQYARGSKPAEPKWWPAVRPSDKFIDSPFNTYQERGLPPSPIANPGVAAVVAALNPKPTECLFYFHDRRGGFYCTKTYAEHVAKLNEVYGLNR